jgi:hypothetical protein
MLRLRVGLISRESLTLARRDKTPLGRGRTIAGAELKPKTIGMEE